MAKPSEIKTALAKRGPLQTIEDSLKASMKNLGQALPSHMKPERLSRVVLSMLKMSPRLQECTPISVMAAVFQMAQIGLEPIDGQAYIIPYRNNKKKEDGNWHSVMEAQFQIGYKGYVTLFYRHLASLALYWGIVKENDKFKFDKGKNELSHIIDLKSDRGEPYAYWVKARLQNGAEIFEVMSKIDVLKHAQEHSKSFDKKTGKFFDDTPWAREFDSMALKTVLIQLMKLLPKSVEIQRAIAMDETTKTKIEPDMTEVPDETDWTGDPVETTAEVLPETPVPTDPPPPPAPTKKPVSGGKLFE